MILSLTDFISATAPAQPREADSHLLMILSHTDFTDFYGGDRPDSTDNHKLTAADNRSAT